MLALLLAAQVQLTTVSFPSKDPGVTLSGTLYAEQGAARSPAVVLLHGCGGVDADMDEWARWLVDNGYVALVVDSFTPRRVQSVCGTQAVPAKLRALDAFGALAYLRTLTPVDGAHVGEIGFSDGGGAVLWTENAGVAAGAGYPSGGFAAAVALYPTACGANPTQSLLDPLLLLVGNLDDWVDAHVCAALVGSLAPSGAHAQIMVYNDAFHAFDDPRAGGVAQIGRDEYTLRYDAEAAADAHARVLAFFKKYL